MLTLVMLTSCSKKDGLSNSDGGIGGGTSGGNPIPTPAPSGSVNAVNNSIGYNEKVKINYAFTNADSVWVGT